MMGNFLHTEVHIVVGKGSVIVTQYMHNESLYESESQNNEPLLCKLGHTSHCTLTQAAGA